MPPVADLLPLAVSEGFVVAAVVVSALTLGLYLVITASRTAKVSRRLDEIEAALAADRPAPPAGPAAPGSRPEAPAGGRPEAAPAAGAAPTGKPVPGRPGEHGPREDAR